MMMLSPVTLAMERNDAAANGGILWEGSEEDWSYGEGDEEYDPLVLLGAGATLRERKRMGKKGSMLGASLIFSGTAVGAGMIALPAEMAGAGWAPSQTTLLLAWIFTYISSMLVLELSWIFAEGGQPAGFYSVAGETLGSWGQAAIALLFWFLLTCLTVAYTAGGGGQVQQLAASSGVPDASFLACTTIYLVAFAAIGVVGTKAVDFVNRIFVYGLLIALAGLLGVGLPQIDPTLLERAEWRRIWPEAVSICILAFGAMNTVPTILQYLGGDVKRTKTAILFGSLTPLVMYCLWTTTVLGIVPYSDDLTKDKVLEELSAVSGSSTISTLIQAFSVCSISSSMAGASVSYIDFILDALGDAKWAPPRASLPGRVLAALITLGPTLAFANLFPNSFLGALEAAGLLGGVSLYGVLPALMVWCARRQESFGPPGGARGRQVGDGFGHVMPTNVMLSSSASEDWWPAARAGGGSRAAMPGRVGGGDFALALFGAMSMAVVLPEAVRQGGRLVGGG